jgi:hypothetical protein
MLAISKHLLKTADAGISEPAHPYQIQKIKYFSQLASVAKDSFRTIIIITSTHSSQNSRVRPKARTLKRVAFRRTYSNNSILKTVK